MQQPLLIASEPQLLFWLEQLPVLFSTSLLLRVSLFRLQLVLLASAILQLDASIQQQPLLVLI